MTQHARRLVAIVVAIGLIAVGGCRWREGRSVLLPPDDELDADHAGLSGISAADLWALIHSEAEEVIIFDVRERAQCENAHIPGARCNPWDGTAFDEEIRVPDEQGWLVVYDQNGELMPDVMGALPPYTNRTTAYLASGFGEWSDSEFEIEPPAQ